MYKYIPYTDYSIDITDKFNKDQLLQQYLYNIGTHLYYL